MLRYTFLGMIPVTVFEQCYAKIFEIINYLNFGTCIINEKLVACAPSFLEDHHFCLCCIDMDAQICAVVFDIV